MADHRLSALDASFLHIESPVAHMHVASVLIFEGDPPAYDELLHAITGRLHLVPRYRQKLAFVPFGQGRPRWVDDPRLNLRYHVRAAALPAPGSEAQLRELAGQVLSQQLDRDKPLWEIWVVEGLEGGRFALLGKTHHALVDGVAGMDIITVLFDASPEPAAPPDPGRPWLPRPEPSRTQLLAEALAERATAPGELARPLRGLLGAPLRALGGAREAAQGAGALVWKGLKQAPATLYNEPIGPHRRFTWVRTELADLKAIKDELGGTVNDVVLATVAGGLGRHLRRRGVRTDGLELRALVPVSVRADVEHGALGNRVAAIVAPLPVWCRDAEARLRLVSERLAGLKRSGQAVGAELITELGGFAPQTVLGQAARLIVRQRWFNLVVTNVPGPQLPLYLLGRRLLDAFPMVPLVRTTAVGVALMSYNGRVDFGLVGDYDLLWDLDDLAHDLYESLSELARAAGFELSEPLRPYERAVPAPA